MERRTRERSAPSRLNLPEKVYVTWKPVNEHPEVKVTLDIAAHKTAAETGYFAARLSSEVLLEDVEIISPGGDVFLVHPENLKVTPRAPGLLLGRFSGEPEEITIQGNVRPARITVQGAVSLIPFSITFSGSMRVEDIPSLPAEWAKARVEDLAKMMTEYGRNDFCAHEILRLTSKYELDVRRWRSQRFWRRNELTELDGLFAIATGAAAIEESLQLETLRQVQESAVAEQTVPITSLSGPEIESHPYAEMLGDSVCDAADVASLAPFNSLYVRFASAGSAYQFLDYLGVWGADILRIGNVTDDASRTARRVEEQLCVEFDKRFEPFAPLAISDIAIVLGDPYVYEAADITLIFHLKNKTIFESTAKVWNQKARDQYRSLREEQSEYRGNSIRSFTTDDSRVSSHSAYIEDYAIYSNNLPALKRILDVQAGEIRSLAEMDDFRYMRSILGSSDEDAFIYMGDEFVRKVVGPEDKIKEMRRITCKDNMLRLEDARQGYRIENRRDADIPRLFEERFLSPFPTCPNGGMYQLGVGGLVSCSAHGRRDNLNHLSSLSIEKVTPKEAELYEDFQKRYHSYFTQYFDPIGIQIRMGEKIALKTCILPLIQNSVYRGFQEIAGDAPIEIGSERIFPAGTVLGAFLKLRIFDGYKSDLSHISDEELRKSVLELKQEAEKEVKWNLEQDIFSWIGNKVTIGTYDFFPSLFSTQVFVILELKDRELAQKAVDRFIEMALGQEFESVVPFEYEGYQIKLVYTGFGIGFAMGLTEELLILGSNGTVVQKTMDIVKAGAAIESPVEDKCNFALNIDLKNSRIFKKYLEGQTARRSYSQCRKNRLALMAMIDIFREDPDMPTGQEVLEKISQMRKLPYCPEGGEYSYSSEERVVCGIHGSEQEPKHAKSLFEEGRLRKFFDGVDQITVSLEFTEHGIITVLRVDNPASPSLDR
ncbi:DUF3352 domain-containing protein [Candidatus Poribacteria bacterium]